ncbi:MAG: ThiF family adenylyltransferase [Candidatus Nanoarchaeia archaeon]|nr:ThiF family adenylyltransferase [Candidatus Nanoarchaeia archaeon]
MRYNRQALYLENDALLRGKKVAIVGIGALGSVAAELLVRAGIGWIILIDRDSVELSNLQRQSLFDENDVGKMKAIQAKEHLDKINSDVTVEAFSEDLDYENIDLINADLVLDCTDNLETRHLINEYCNKKKIKWIYSGAIQNRGFIFNVIPDNACFNCIVKAKHGVETCDTVGVLNSITHTIGSLQVNEAVKLLLNKDYEKDLMHINLENNEIKKLKVNKDSECEVCNGNYEYLSGKQENKLIKLCGTGKYQIKGDFDFEGLKKRFGKEGDVIILDNLTIFKNRVLVKAKDEAEAKSLYSKFIGA